MEALFKDHKEFEHETIGRVIEGEIPSWLNGTLLRTGPAKWDLDHDFSMNHYLDGLAMALCFEIDPKSKTVRAIGKFLKSDAYRKCCEQKRPVYTEFGTRAYTDHSKNAITRAFNKIVPSDLTDNDISNVYKISDDEIYMTTESCNIWRIDPTNLDSLLKVNLDKKAGIAISCSHPLYSEEDKVVWNVGSTFLTGMKYHIMKVPIGSKIKKTSFENSKIVCSFNSSYKASLAYNHSFALTKNYVIVIEQSLLVNGLKLATCTPKGDSLEECLEWTPNEPSRFHVFDKRTNTLLKHKYHSKPFFFFHTINAYEQDDQIVLDIVNYDDHGLLESMQMKHIRAGIYDPKTKSLPRRYVLPLGDPKTMKRNVNLVNVPGCGSTTILNDKGVFEMVGEALGPSGVEMPSINPKYFTKNYRFFYGTGFIEKGFMQNACAKFDIKTKTAKPYRHSSTTYPGEPVFVPSPNGTEEDDGVLLVVVLEHDPKLNHFLAILDAKTLDVIAKVELRKDEISVPATLHGIWLPNKKADA